VSDAPTDTAPAQAQPAENEATPETEQPEATPVDPVRQPLLDLLTSELSEALLGSDIDKGDIVVRVERLAWRRAAEVCRDRLGMDYFCFLSGLDWKLAPELSGEKTFEPAGAPIDTDTADDDDADTADDAERDTEGANTDRDDDRDDGGSDEQAPDKLVTGRAGGDTRFQVFARFYSVGKHLGITLKADLDENDPRVESITSVYRGADWHERETWEMYGFDFEGHPGLRHMYLPGEFEGYPLRKDFPLLAREVKPWPGLVDVEPLPGEAEAVGSGDTTGGVENEASTEGGE
jgi:NADH-quinone oxidoreductase subunit C